VTQYEPLRRGFAEFVGAFALIFVGAGSVLTSTVVFGQLVLGQQGILAGGFSLVAVAFAHGLVIAVMASALGHISGGHFNPAITLGFVVTRRIAPALAVVYWVAQFAGGACGALLLRWVFTESTRNAASLGAPATGQEITGVNPAGGLATRGVLDNPKAIVVEAVLTFFLVWVVFATATDPRGAFKSIAGLAIGLTITFDILIGGPLTGAMMNPARAFGPELVQRAWDDWYVWYAGPFGGAAIAALAYDYLFLRPVPRPIPVGEPGSGIAEPRPGITAES
jgi:MIP family channel proteins